MQSNGLKRQPIPFPALALGLGGLLPFLFSALLVTIPSVLSPLLPPGLPMTDTPEKLGAMALGAYGAVILSFLGGVRWGNLLDEEQQLEQWSPLCLSVVPSLIAWLALLLPTPVMLSVLIAGFILQYMLDVNGVAQRQLPAWFGRLRLILTTGAVVCLLGGLVGGLVGS